MFASFLQQYSFLCSILSVYLMLFYWILLSYSEVIAVNQDPMGKMGRRFFNVTIKYYFVLITFGAIFNIIHVASHFSFLYIYSTKLIRFQRFQNNIQQNWARELADGSMAVAIMNTRHDMPTYMSVDFSQVSQ